MDNENVIDTHSGILFGSKEKLNYEIQKKIDGTGKHTENGSLDSESQIPHISSHM